MAAEEPLRRVLFAGGGTGGHVYMAVAVARRIEQEEPDVQFLFVGTRRGLESRILPDLGYRLETIRVGGINRVGWKRALWSFARIPASIAASRRLVQSFEPSVVAGVGGYAAGPVTVAARLCGCPALLIEPNAYPGLTNRLLRRWVQRAAVAYPEARAFYGSKAELTGVPIRKDFHAIADVELSEPLRLLVLGGSQGSVGVNRLVGEALVQLGGGGFEVLHQAGRHDAGSMRDFYDGHGLEVRVEEFIDPMPRYLARAHLVVSRAGASAVAEVTAAGRAAILVPFPHAADDHQRRNARAVVEAGAARLLEEETATPTELADVLTELRNDPQALVKMGRAARRLSPRDSTNRVIRLMRAISR